MAGIAGVLPVVTEHLRGNTCPQIGPVPLCFVVLSAYGLVAISTLFNARFRTILFVIGWVLLFGLAMTGSSLELLVGDTCPQARSGIPTCFISLFLTLLLVGAYFFDRGGNSTKSAV
jgi:hypothetical protein